MRSIWEIKYQPNPSPPTIASGTWAGHYDAEADKHKPWLVTQGSGGRRFKDFETAQGECYRRNFLDAGIRVAPYSDRESIPVYDSKGEFIAMDSSAPFNYTYEELLGLPTLNSGQAANLKVRTSGYSVWLDRALISDYRDYCEDDEVAAASPASRLVWVWDSSDVLIALYLAIGEDDGFMPYREQILQDERRDAI